MVAQLDSTLIGRLVRDLSTILGRHDEAWLGTGKELRELMQQRRRTEAAHAEAEEALRAHPMICPKDGHDMFSEPFHTIILERCQHCHGIFLDANEVDEVVARDDQSQMGRFVRDFWAVLRGHRKGPK